MGCNNTNGHTCGHTRDPLSHSEAHWRGVSISDNIGRWVKGNHEASSRFLMEYHHIRQCVELMLGERLREQVHDHA